MTSSLKILTWNAQGLKQKDLELRLLVEKYGIDICLISETKLADDTPFRMTEGYELYRACHKEGYGPRAGSAVLIKKTIHHDRLDNIVECDQVHDPGRPNVKCFQVARVRLRFNNEWYQVGSFYAQSGHRVQEGDFRGLFRKMGSAFLLGGDFNGHHVAWNNENRNIAGKQLFGAIQQESLEIMAPTSPTYIPDQSNRRPSVMDFFVGKNVKMFCGNPEAIGALITDHLPVLMVMRVDGANLQNPCSSSDHVNRPSPQPNHRNIPSEMSTTGLKSLRVGLWNSQGLAGKEQEVFQFIQDIDILMITQTHNFPHCIKIDGYEIYKADHPTSTDKGGSALLIRKSIPHVPLPPIVEEFVQITCVSIHFGGNQFQFCSLYSSPEDSHINSDLFYMDIFVEALEVPSSNVVVGGGFNVKHPHWNSAHADYGGDILNKVVDILCLQVHAPRNPTFWPHTEAQAEVADFFISKGPLEVIEDPRSYFDSSSEHKPVRVTFGSA